VFAGTWRARRTRSWDDEVQGFGARLNRPGKLSLIIKYVVKGDPPAPRHARRLPGDSGEGGPGGGVRDPSRCLPRPRSAGRAASGGRRGRRTAAGGRAARDARGRAAGWLAGNARSGHRDKAARGEAQGYERELLRLEARTIRPEIGTERAGKLDPERFQALVLLQPTVNHARNLRNALARFTKWANAETTRRGAPLKWPTAFAVEGRPRSRKHRFTIEEAARLWIGAGTLGRRGAMVRCMLLTACRRSEAASMEWAHLRLRDAVLGPYWEQPGRLTKSKEPHRVPLAAPGVAMLRWLPPRVTKKAGPAALVFAGRGNKTVGGWTLIRRALLASADVTPARGTTSGGPSCPPLETRASTRRWPISC
jgi:integrase